LIGGVAPDRARDERGEGGDCEDDPDPGGVEALLVEEDREERQDRRLGEPEPDEGDPDARDPPRVGVRCSAQGPAGD
jgi:hypothetical protein